MIRIASPMMGREEIEAVKEVLKSGRLAQGPKVEEFENRIAEYVDTEYAIATSSGTTALHIALLALGIKPKDEVITTPFTFIATANSVLFCNAKPIFADIDEKTFNIDSESVEEKITKRVKGIIPVHLYGQPVDMKSLMDIARDNKLFVIEDAAQALGAEYKGKKVGSFGDCAIFSFYATKNITTGEGGMIVTNDRKLAEKCKKLRSHGERIRYVSDILGFNFRMTEIAAAIGLVQLSKLEKFTKRRIKNAEFLTQKLRRIKKVETPFVMEGVRHVFHQYTIKAPKRNKLKDFLFEKGIESKIYYPIPIYKQPLYRKLGYNDKLPNVEKVSKRVLSLPVHPALTKNELKFVANSIEKFFRG
jgi:dTDP-4-amino-4,6-dideoxygalactose transaminase